jgi:uncharacterized RDD family membrane protein YckC
MLTCTLILLLLSLAFFRDFYFANTKVLDWQYLLYAFIVFLFNALYFVLIPSISRGRTLFKWIMKIRTAELKDKKLFAYHIFIKEMLIWGIPYFCNLFIIIYGYANGSIIDAFSSISNFTNKLDPWQIISRILSYFSFLYFLCIFISYAVNSKRRNVIDKATNTCVIYASSKKDIKQQKPEVKKSNTINNNVPGIIDTKELEDL